MLNISVRFAEKNLHSTEPAPANTVAVLVMISPAEELPMTENEIHYLSTVAQLKIMVKKQLITADEFTLLERKFAEKYCIKIISLYRP